MIATLLERSPRRLPNALARKLPPDIGAFGVSSTIGSEPDWHFQDKPIHLNGRVSATPATADRFFTDHLLLGIRVPTIESGAVTVSDVALA